MPAGLGTGVNVGKAIAHLDLDITKFSAGMASALSELKAFEKSSEMSISTAMQTVGTSMSKAGTTLTKSVTVPLAAVGGLAVKTAADFDTSMSKVEAISGATADKMVDLKNKAIEMGAKTKFSAKESADAFTYMAMAGWDADQMIAGISGVMNLAAASGEDLAMTSDIVTDALTAFGMEAGDASRFADILAKASSSANTNVSMLGESFKYVAPVAGALGMTVEDTSVALALMANSGIKASQAGTSLRSALTNMVKPTDQMKKVMNDLGIEVTNSDGSMKSLKEIMDILRGTFGNLTEAEQANAAATLFGKTAMSGMLAIINSSDKDYRELTEAIYGSKDAAEDMANTMMDNLNGAITLLKSAIESLLIKIGTAMTPVIREWAEALTKVVEWLNTLSDEQIQHIVKIAAVIAAIGPLLIIIGKVISAIGTIITAIKGIGTAITMIGPVFEGLMSIGGAIFAGIQAIAGFVTGTLIPAILAIDPVILIIIAAIGALIAIGVQVYKHWDELKEKAKETFDNISSKVEEAKENIKQSIDNLIANGREALENAKENISTFFKNIWDDVTTFFSGLGEKFMSFYESAKSKLEAAFSYISSSVIGFFNDILGKLSQFFSDFSAGFQSLLSKAQELFTTLKNSVADLFSKLMSTMSEAFSGIMNTLSTFVGNAYNAISSFVGNMLNKAQELASKFGSTIMNGIKSLASDIPNLFSGILSSFDKMIDAFINVGKNLMTALWNGFKAVFPNLAKWIEDNLKKITEPIKKITDSVSSLFSGISSVLGGVKDTVSGLFGKITGSHANGLDYVPFNGYVAELHEGEKVLTKSEAKEYDGNSNSGKNGDMYITFNSPKAIDEYEAAKELRRVKKELEWT